MNYFQDKKEKYPFFFFFFVELLLVALSEFPEVLRTPPMGEVEKPLLEFFAACIDHDRDAVRENVTKLLLAG